jgi:CheY-like chemotaxis protein
VFGNLFNNAQKFTDSDGLIVLRSSDVGENSIRIEVVDTGMGIDSSVIPKLFTAFEQGQIREVQQNAGLGLGLAIAKNLVEAHGGTIRAFSQGRGKGATFAVELPGAIANAQTAAPSVRFPSTAKAPLHVLVVEDHPPTLELLSRLLTLMGHRVTRASSVATAIAAAGQEQFSLLLSDLGLPDGTGLDLMRQLRDRYEHKGIALTGYGTAEDVRRSKEAGFAAHLTKPVDLERLQTAISEVVAASTAA